MKTNYLYIYNSIHLLITRLLSCTSIPLNQMNLNKYENELTLLKPQSVS